MKKILIALMILLMIPCLLGLTYSRTQEIQQTAHEIAELARSIGLTEDDPIIVRAQELRAQADAEFQRDVDIVAVTIHWEAGHGTTTEHKERCGAVIVNRLHSDKFPNTIEEVITQPNQYLAAYADPNSYYSKTAKECESWEECREIAAKALRGEIECPENVLYQAEFVQGTGIYEIYKTSYSTTYFCYG